MSDAFAEYATAEAALATTESRLRDLADDISAAARDFETADARAVEVFGLEQLGEATPEDAATARAELQTADYRLRGLRSAEQVLVARRQTERATLETARRHRVNALSDAAQEPRAVATAELHAAAAAFGAAYCTFARIDATAKRISIGTQDHAALNLSAGDVAATLREHGVAVDGLRLSRQLAPADLEEIAASSRPAREHAA